MPPRRQTNFQDVGKSSTPSDLGAFRKNSNLSHLNRYSTALDNVSAESLRIKHHGLTIKRRKLFLILLATLVMVSGLAFLISQFTANIKLTVLGDISNVEEAGLSKYKDVIQDYLSANPLSRLRFVMNDSELVGYVKNELNEVSDVTKNSTAAGIGVSEFRISFRKPVASWKIGTKQYYVDADGIAFDVNYYSNSVVSVVDKSGAYMESGEASISRRFLGFVGQVVSLVNDSGYEVSELILPENTTRQLNLKLKNPELLVKMTIDRAVNDQVDDMKRAVDHFTDSGIIPSYIDVRVNDKVFYL